MKKRILIIDDDAAVRESLKKVLLEINYDVALAQDGKEGSEVLQKDHFDLLILDLNIPELSGFDILDITEEQLPSVPVIVLTGMADQCVPGSLASADAVLQKPPDVALLMATIEKLVTQPRTRPSDKVMAEPSGAAVPSGAQPDLSNLGASIRQFRPGNSL